MSSGTRINHIAAALFGWILSTAHACPSAEQPWAASLALTRAVNDERALRHNLPRLTVSRTLIDVAQKHVRNLEQFPFADRPCGSMHSWFANGLTEEHDWSTEEQAELESLIEEFLDVRLHLPGSFGPKELSLHVYRSQ